jgi:hypothetical protein
VNFGGYFGALAGVGRFTYFLIIFEVFEKHFGVSKISPIFLGGIFVSF